MVEPKYVGLTQLYILEKKMSQNSDPLNRRSRSPEDSYAKRSFLSKIDKSQLTALRVSIKRAGVIALAPNIPLERSIDDYTKICSYVHVRKGIPPRVPVFGSGIKVDQEYRETVFQHESSERTSRQLKSNRKSISRERRRRRSKSRSRERSRHRSKSVSVERSRRRSTSTSRSRRSKQRDERRVTRNYKSRSRERHYSTERRNRRDNSRDKSTKSRSRSPRSRSRYKERSITPLRPGEYRPGHPDLALRNEKRRVRRSHSGSPRSHDGRTESSRSRERRSPAARSRSRRRRSRSRRRSPPRTPMIMPGMEYGYHEGYAPYAIPPYRAHFPMVDPNFYARMPYPHGMMMPRMPMMHPRMPIRQRFPIYNQGVKSVTPKPATVTSEQQSDTVIVEEPSNVSTDTNEGVTSSGPNEEVTVSEASKEQAI